MENKELKEKLRGVAITSFITGCLFTMTMFFIYFYW